MQLNISVAIVTHNNKLILIKRKKEPFKDILSLPGGKIKETETPEQAIARELEEETGLTTKTIEYVGHYDETIIESSTPIHKHNIKIFKIQPENFNFHSSNEGEAFSIPLKNLNSFKNKIVPSDILFIQRTLNGEKNFSHKITLEKHKNGSYSIVKEN